jgi:beta-lactam-binding protein with PASTA domain
VIGLRLAVARARIGRANCIVGKVRRVRSRRGVGKVLGQSPKAGSVRPRGAKVKLTVGRH